MVLGPTEISIVDPDAVLAINSSTSRCIRAPWYNMADPLKSLFDTRDRREHDRRRKVWDRAFNMKALRNYESRINSYTEQLIQRLETFETRPVNVSLWFSYYAFDVMSDLGFGKSLDMLKTGSKHFIVQLLEDGQKGLGIIAPLPWLYTILTRTPVISAPYYAFVGWCEDQLLARQKVRGFLSFPMLTQ